VRRERIAVGTVGARDIQKWCVAKRLLKTLADGMVVVLRFNTFARAGKLTAPRECCASFTQSRMWTITPKKFQAMIAFFGDHG
jgi:hypothetical protein